MENALLGAEAGHTVFLMDHPYNRGAEGPFTRVQDWTEIERAVLCTVA